MTDDSIYGTNNELATVLSAATKELLRQSRQLGLSWTLRIATISTFQVSQSAATLPQPEIVTGIYDGDTSPINLTNMTGRILNVGTRVYCLLIPPAGNFIVGLVSTELTAAATLRCRNPSYTIAGGVDHVVSFTTVDQETGGDWITVPSVSVFFPRTAWYSITVVTVTDTGGALNSRQEIQVFLTNNISGMGGYVYSTFWGPGETNGSVGIVIPVAAGDDLSVHMRQNSVGSMNAATNLIIAELVNIPIID